MKDISKYEGKLVAVQDDLIDEWHIGMVVNGNIHTLTAIMSRDIISKIVVLEDLRGNKK